MPANESSWLTSSDEAAPALRGVVGRYLAFAIFFVLLHVAFLLCRYGHLPVAPVLGDEVIVNDPAISLAEGRGYVATSFGNGKYGLDHLYAHYPPVYGAVVSLAIRVFGLSVYSLRLTTTLMSIGSSVVLCLLLFRCCRIGLLSWNAAILVNGIYDTNVGLLTLERTARMESMIGLLVLLALLALFHGFSKPAHTSARCALLAGFCGGMAVAVHPEAIAAVPLLALLMMYIPAKKCLGGISLFLIVPMAVALVSYRRQTFAAAGQFMAIMHESGSLRPVASTHGGVGTLAADISSINHSLFLWSVIFLLVAAAVGGIIMALQQLRGRLVSRLAICSGIAAGFDLLLIVFAFHADELRVQFMFGPLLVMNAVCLVGMAKLKRWQSAFVCVLVCVQCVGVSAYLMQRRHSPVAADPDRFSAIIASLPPGASVAATPRLWLDFREAHRPFTLLYHGLGESGWDISHGNPFDRYDIILRIDGEPSGLAPEMYPWAEMGRTRTSYSIGDEVVDVYTRNLRVPSSSHVQYPPPRP